jgi:hypothetical protein
MPKVVAVHGIAQQLRGEETLRALWLPALRDGLTRAGSRGLLSDDRDFACAFYGDLFRQSGHPTGKALDFPWEAEDVSSDWEHALLAGWWEEAMRIDPEVPPPDQKGTKARTPAFVQSALYALTQSRFFSGVAERVMIGNLRQVHSYLHDLEVRALAQARLAEVMTGDTRVLIGHSLGSVVAYETLCTEALHQKRVSSVRTFVTLGSPLGIRNLIFDRLRPSPVSGKGAWPGNLERWFNVADSGDVVALTKTLAPLFEGSIEDTLVHNGATAHDVIPYLTAKETGRAIAAGLTR